MPQISVWMGRAHRLLPPVMADIGARFAQGKPSVLLVPEQFTLQAERELLDRLHISGFFTIEVLSPSRFGQRVLAAVGADARAPLNAAGRQMAVSVALERCEKHLRFYASAARRRGFAEKLATLIADLKRGGLTPQQLAEHAQTLPEGMRRAKLTDLATLYAAYGDVLGERFGDSEDQLRYIASRLPECDLLNGKTVYVYGFDALPQQLTELLCVAGGLCEQLVVALTCEPETAADGELYRPVRQSVARFAAALRERGLTLAEVQLPPEALPHAPAIRHLDEALFALPERRFAGEQASVYLSQHMSPFEEATFASRKILRLCEQGMDMERIAVLYPDQNGYAFAVAAAFTDSGLPFYTDEKLPASAHALARFLLSALRAMANDFAREDVVAVMKSGYAPLEFDEACALENYARTYGVNRKKWLAPLTRGEPELAAHCETLRKRLMEPLARARAGIVSARDTRASLEALMGLLTDVHAYETLQQEERALTAAGMLVRAGQNSQMWQTLLELMDQMVAVCDGARIPLSHMADRFASGFAAVSLAALPPATGMLHAGALGHYLSGDMDAVFLLGLNDGVLTREADSLLTEEERAQTQEATGAFLGMTDDSRTQFALMDLKRAMTLPSRFLFLSYAKTDPSGTALRPLDLLAALQTRLFDGLPESPFTPETLPMSSAQAFSELSGILRTYADGDQAQLPERWRERLARLLAAPATAEAAARLMRAADYRVEGVPLPPDMARKLFHDRTLSVSRLETFAGCPFRHFVEYGLRPQVVKDWGVEPVDLGDIFHRGLQNFATLAENCGAYPNVPVSQAETMADEALAPLMDELLQGPMGDSPRGLAGFERARRILRRACATVTQHLCAGDFRLYRAEAIFGEPGPDSLPPVTLRLPDGTEVSLRGKIDRVDRLDTGGETYLRVVDYKSSAQTLEPARTWWGLQLQLTLYLDAAVRGLDGAVPAGAFYFHVADPLAKIELDDPALAESDISRQLQMKGVVLADEEVLSAMDRGEGTQVMGAALNRDGGIRKTAMALDRAQMNALLAHARAQATELAEALFAGDTAILPVRSGTLDNCAYCACQAVCGFEAKARGAQARELPELKLDEWRERLRQEEASAGQR